MKKLLRDLLEEEGNVLIIIVLSFSMLLGFTALAVDVGVLYLEKTRLSRTVDAVVLAAAQELPDRNRATGIASEYAHNNGIDSGDLTVSFDSGDTRVEASAQKNVKLNFAGVFGYDTSLVNVKAAAKISLVKGVRGLVPLGIDESMLPLIHGNQYVIKIGAPSIGWTGIIEYPGESGKDDYRNSARYGYDGLISVGDQVAKAPGNASGPTIQGLQERIDSSNETWENYQPDSPRVILVPIYRVLGQSPSDKLEIIGFASVFIEKILGQGNENEVHVRYVNHTVSGETDDTLTNSYLKGVRLVE